MASSKDPNQIAGWMIAKNRDLEYVAYKRIDGKARFVKLGTSLDGAEDKLTVATLRYTRPEGGQAA